MISQTQQMGSAGNGTRRRRSIGLVAAGAAFALAAGITMGTSHAEMSGEALVECNTAYGTMEVTPRVVSDHADVPQWTATRVWIAAWNSSGRTWEWGAQEWKIEQASQQNSPIAADISLLDTQMFRPGNGYFYVYVESYMWNGGSWYGQEGALTRTYTQVTPSVSHEPDTRTQATYCTL